MADFDICGQTNDSKTVRLKFLRSELLYDIKNYAFVEADVMGEERQHGQHVLAEIGEEGNVDRVNRILAVVHAAAVEMLYPYTKVEPQEEVKRNFTMGKKSPILLSAVLSGAGAGVDVEDVKGIDAIDEAADPGLLTDFDPDEPYELPRPLQAGDTVVIASANTSPPLRRLPSLYASSLSGVKK